LHTCEACGGEIEGAVIRNNVVVVGGGRVSVPSNCGHCGAVFPWGRSLTTEEPKVSSETSADPMEIVRNIGHRFHTVSRQLLKRYSSRPTIEIRDEYDVQDLLHALLLIHFDDVRPEEWTPSYAGKNSRIDFLLKAEKILVEVKHTRKNLQDSKVGEELIIDSQRYRTHKDCEKLFCFVYDPGEFLSNPRGLEADLSEKGPEFEIEVLVVPGHRKV